jgi:hypothetical protein
MNISAKAQPGCRYYIHDGPAAFRLELSGNLLKHCVAELEQAWSTASSAIGERAFLVDVTSLKSLDDAARELLRRWHAAGAQLAGHSPDTKLLINSITREPARHAS